MTSNDVSAILKQFFIACALVNTLCVAALLYLARTSQSNAEAFAHFNAPASAVAIEAAIKDPCTKKRAIYHNSRQGVVTNGDLDGFSSTCRASVEAEKIIKEQLAVLQPSTAATTAAKQQGATR